METRGVVRRTTKLFVSLAIALGVLIVILACPGAGSTVPPLPVRITLCAVDSRQSSACSASDFSNNTIVSGDVQGQGATQLVDALLVRDDNGQPLANTKVTLKIAGANASTMTATTNGQGVAALTYQGNKVGTDTIAAALPASMQVRNHPRPLVVHWLTPQTYDHPIIFLHGINENAASIESEAEWTTLFEGLKLTYNPADIETFCYLDDKAYADGPVPSSCQAPEAPPLPEAIPCVSRCVSQSSVDDNALLLAQRVISLFARTGRKVTLIGYSMGASITRTMLAGCLTPVPHSGISNCLDATNEVDQVFFLNGVQQGSWLLHAADAKSLVGANSPFVSVISAIEQRITDQVKSKIGLDVNNPAEKDLAPGSQNIYYHNHAPVPISPNMPVYTFYGNIQVQIGVTEYIDPASGQASLGLGDLVVLGQGEQDDPTALPVWGGTSLCGGCLPQAPDALGYHGSWANQPGYSSSNNQFHAWALTDHFVVNVADIVPNVGTSFKAVLNAPEMHTDIFQSMADAPGSSVQVEDITGMAGSRTTDLPYEILLILKQGDHLA